MINRLSYVAEKENLKFKKNILEVVNNIAKGDLRKAINLMQSATVGKEKRYLDEKLCYDVAGYPKPSEIKSITDILIDNSINLENSLKKIQKIVLENGYSISIILKEVIEFLVTKINNKEIDASKYCYIFSELSNLESKVSKSTFGDIYLSMLVSIFKQKTK